jgi:hypothetical protein
MSCKLNRAMNSFFALSLTVGFVTASTTITQADIVLTSLGTTVLEDFNDFRGDGFAPNPTSGQLDSTSYRALGFSDGDGVFGGTHDSGDFARGTATAGVTEGGAYAFEVSSSNYAVGVQPTDDDFTPGNFTVRVRNETGVALNSVTLSATGYFFNDEDFATRWTFQGSLNDSFYVDLFTLDSIEAADDTPVWDPVPISETITFPFPVADGERFYLRIVGDDLSGSGARDQFALDNLAVTAIPEPASLGVLIWMFCPFLRRSRRKTA